MSNQTPDTPRHTAPARGNYVAEWFGYRVWPTVDSSDNATRDQTSRLCPFLTIAKKETTTCVKTARGYDESTGVCTISSDADGQRLDWLACPHRILDQHFTILGGAVRTIYGIPDEIHVVLLPTTVLLHPDRRDEVCDGLARTDARVFAFCANKLGGEVDIPETASSPGGKVDASVIEILGCDQETKVPNQFGNHMFFEIQTADFHGSPLHAVRLLAEKCPEGAANPYHHLIEQHPEDCGRSVEGPNKANIFKRTIYQMILKMELARAPGCAGFGIVLPLPVWESWLRHLGRPVFKPADNDPDVFRFDLPADVPAVGDENPAWIFVFDINQESPESPQPLRILFRIAASPMALIHFAFKAAPDFAIQDGAIERYRKVLIRRVTKGWNG